MFALYFLQTALVSSRVTQTHVYAVLPTDSGGGTKTRGCPVVPAKHRLRNFCGGTTPPVCPAQTSLKTPVALYYVVAHMRPGTHLVALRIGTDEQHRKRDEKLLRF